MSSPNRPRRPAPALLKDLRARIRRLERHAPGAGNAYETEDASGPLPFGVGDIDAALPWGGLPRACLHEVGGGDGAATGFCAALLARFAGGGGVALWCRRGRGLYGPGLATFGLDPERLIVVRGRSGTDVLWAMEEGLRSGSPAAVLGEADAVTPTAARRLQLAAEGGGVTALLLRPAGKATPSPAVTRWRVSAAPSTISGGGVGIRWKVELLRCRGGGSRSWFVEWHNGTTGGFSVAAGFRHRSAEPAQGRITRLAD